MRRGQKPGATAAATAAGWPRTPGIPTLEQAENEDRPDRGWPSRMAGRARPPERIVPEPERGHTFGLRGRGCAVIAPRGCCLATGTHRKAPGPAGAAGPEMGSKRAFP